MSVTRALALSIRQPWAWLIVNGWKDVENRSWPTSYRGRFLVHASKGCTRDEYESARDFAAYAKGIDDLIPPLAEIERGGIVGEAEIVGCVRASISPWFVGDYGFVLRNAHQLPFRQYKGALGFFPVAPLGQPFAPRSAVSRD